MTPDVSLSTTGKAITLGEDGTRGRPFVSTFYS